MEQTPERTTLCSVFESTKTELASQLDGLVLPKDSVKVQTVIADYLNHVCDEESDFRQNLTQSEDYILQAALSMLNAQRDLVAAFECVPEAAIEEPAEVPPVFATPEKAKPFQTINSQKAFIGAGGGALVGKLIFGGWGAVFGAIAGTAVALYLSQQPQAKNHEPLARPALPAANPESADAPVNTAALLNVIGQICESLDNLIATFRAQIQRVVTKYESQEKPTIERNFRTLLEGIQSLIGYKRGHSSEEDKYVSKLQTRVEDLAELLDNYDLAAVDYTADNADWFEAVESKNTTEIKMVTPAITKNGTLVLKGKIFTPGVK